MKIILVAAQKANFYDTGHFLEKALTEMKHEVIPFDFRVDAATINQDILNVSKPDLLIVWKGSGLKPETINKFKCPTVLWYPDDLVTPWAYKDVQSFGNTFDFIYTPIEENIPQYKSDFDLDVKSLPCGVDINRFHCQNNKEYHKFIDASFIGNIDVNVYFDRVKVLTDLSYYLQVIDKKLYQEKVYLEHYNNVLNHTKINLNIGLRKRGCQLRILEVLGSGNFLLTNDCKFIQDNFSDCVGIFTTNESAVGQYDYYINKDGIRRSMAVEALRRVREGHTWIHRFKQVFEDIGEIE